MGRNSVRTANSISAAFNSARITRIDDSWAHFPGKLVKFAPDSCHVS